MTSWLRVLVALIGLWLAAAPAEAAWLRAESPNFVVHGQGRESALRERILLLEDFDQLLRRLTGTTAPPARNKLHVYIVRGTGQLSLLRPGSTAMVAGFYRTGPGGIAAVADEDAALGENETLFHEYAHHFMYQYFPASYPGWYVEGFAEYMMTARIGADHIDFGGYSRARAYWLTSDDRLPMERVLASDLAGATREAVSSFYAQSWLAVHYFTQDAERRAALGRYLAAVTAGANPLEAFTRETGLSPRDLDRALERHAERGAQVFQRMDRPSADAAPAVTVTRLPESADDLLLHEAALRLGIAEDRRQPTLARIRAAAARHPGDPYARRVLALAEALYGDGPAADALLDPLIAAAPGDVELLYLKGMRHLAHDDPGASLREAQRWFGQAHRADAAHFPTLIRYAESLRSTANYTSENVTNILMLAHQLAPQVAETKLALAHQLMLRGLFEPAETLLAPLAAGAHRDSLADTARALLEQVRARRRAAA